MQSPLPLASHDAAQQTFCYALRHQSAECSAQSEDLGIHFTPYLWARVAGEAGWHQLHVLCLVCVSRVLPGQPFRPGRTDEFFFLVCWKQQRCHVLGLVTV